MRGAFPQSWFLRVLFAVSMLVTIVGLAWWRGPEWGSVGDAFRRVSWNWIAVALVLNLLSVVIRALAWRTVLNQALPREEQPAFPRVFSAFSDGSVHRRRRCHDVRAIRCWNSVERLARL